MSFERLIINKPLGEVIAHHSDMEIRSNRWTTRIIPLLGPRPITGRVNLLLGIVEYDHLMISTLLSCKEGAKKLLLDVGHFHLIFELFAGHLVSDQ